MLYGIIGIGIIVLIGACATLSIAIARGGEGDGIVWLDDAGDVGRVRELQAAQVDVAALLICSTALECQDELISYTQMRLSHAAEQTRLFGRAAPPQPIAMDHLLGDA